MTIGVVVFPGSNADWDALHVVRDVLACDARYVFHTETQLDAYRALIIPGGFSYGDYLRCGAIARFSPIGESIVQAAERGVPILGICNGFQVLTELHLLPGALVRNKQLRFICRDVHLRVECEGVFTEGLKDKVLRMPVAHAEGRYHCDEQTLAMLRADDRIALRYSDLDGKFGEHSNINGSIEGIAGIYNESRNVLGLMPHPERAAERVLGSDDGLSLFNAMKRHLDSAPAAPARAREGRGQ
ncbi:MAG: phosphoribosylformylglycinamidine synthase subunit PurQ [Myxococcales bacterium]|nr:MAG: phosphoribosylformylglycinamidine synthase subunit PurQ [Myxococcales bacterium]